MILKYVFGLGGAWGTFFAGGGFENYGPSLLIGSVIIGGLGYLGGYIVDKQIEKHYKQSGKDLYEEFEDEY